MEIPMSSSLETLEIMVGAQLAQEPLPTRERIRQLITAVRTLPMCSSVTTEEAETLALTFEARHGVMMTIGAVLTEDYEPWLAGMRAKIDPYYWSRYKQLLGKQGFSSHVIATVDSVTDNILNVLENPRKEGPWDRRGMVMGHVQSGKTANYTGLICKAVDAGYKLVIVLAGIHSNLRAQTQLRLDEGVLGFDTQKSRKLNTDN